MASYGLQKHPPLARACSASGILVKNRRTRNTGQGLSGEDEGAPRYALPTGGWQFQRRMRGRLCIGSD